MKPWKRQDKCQLLVPKEAAMAMKNDQLRSSQKEAGGCVNEDHNDNNDDDNLNVERIMRVTTSWKEVTTIITTKKGS